MLCNIASNCGLATNKVWCLMPSPHPYPHLRYPLKSWELRLTIVHLGLDTIQVAPSRGIGPIFPHLMRQPRLNTNTTTNSQTQTFNVRIKNQNMAYPCSVSQPRASKKHKNSLYESILSMSPTLYPLGTKRLIPSRHIHFNMNAT